MLSHLKFFRRAVLVLAFGTSAALADFGLSEDSRFFTIDCGSTPSAIIKVNKSNGNLQSIVVNGTELQRNPRGSHVNSGFGTSQITAKTFGDDRILITVNSKLVLHYYAFKKGEPNVFMATSAGEKCPSPGEMRFIARLDSKVLNLGNTDRPNDDASGNAIESKDIFIQRDGRTTSKYYSGVRFIDDTIHGSRGPNIGAYFAIGSYESSSGGPFFRDINSQTAGDTEEIYFYMFSGHAQTEPFRGNQLHGPYALCFTAGPPPTMPSMGWMSTLDLKGWVSQRGRVTGTASGLMPAVPYTVYLSNNAAQYWARVGSNGKFTTSSMKPGSYTIRLMRNELAVAKASISVGTETITTTLADPGLPDYLWRLGLPDGTPQGFRNAAKMGEMHPSDKRHQPWGPLTFTIRTPVPSDLSGFPAAQWKDVNENNRIVFNLEEADIMDLDLEIGITVSHVSARPVIRVNDRWSSRPLPAPKTYQSRSITFGIYRGFDHVQTIRIPKSALQAGSNTLSIGTISGSTGYGDFLSYGIVYDYIGLRR